MTPADEPDDPLATLLAAGDDALAAGLPPAASLPADAPPETQSQLLHDLSYLRRLRETLRRPRPTTPDGAMTNLGRFQIRRELGRGGHGVVFLAFDTVLNREVALKVPRAEVLVSDQLRERFRREARAAAGLDHPNVVPVYEAGEVGPVCYLVSACCHGPNLAQWLRQHPDPVPFREAADLIATLARAVQHAHERGVLHRDLKPANVLLQPGADAGRGGAQTGTSPLQASTPKITDFGLAKVLSEASTAGQTPSGAIVGTVAYMAPEQAAGQNQDVGPAADVYALGAMLYELVAGRPPFRGESDLDTLHQVCHDEPLPLLRLRPKTPRDLETVCLKCLHKAPARRYASAAELADDLTRFVQGEPIQARPVGRGERALRWVIRRPAVALLTGVSTAAVALVVLLLVMSNLRIARHQSEVEQERDRAEQERQRAVTQLYHTHVGRAQALRQARAPGYRLAVWQELQQALRQDTPDRNVAVLRQEAAACLGDFVGLTPVVSGRLSQDIYALAHHPYQNQVALALNHGEIAFLDVATWAEVGRLSMQTGWPVTGILYGPDGQTLAAGNRSAGVKVWRADANGKWGEERVLRPPRRVGSTDLQAISFAFAPAGRLAACWTGGRVVAVWNVADGAEVGQFKVPGQENLRDLAWSASGGLVAAGYEEEGHHGFLVWEAESGRLLRKLPAHVGSVQSVVFSRDGRWLAGCGTTGIVVLDTQTFQPEFSLYGEGIYQVVFRPDGRTLAIPSRTGTIHLWDFIAKREEAVCGFKTGLWHVAFSPSGKTLLAAWGRTIARWDLNGTGEKLLLSGHRGAIAALAVSTNGRLLASAGKDQQVRLWDLTTGELRRVLAGFRGELQAVGLDSEAQLLVTGDASGDILVWDVATGQKRTALVHSLGTEVTAVGFSPNGQTLAAAGPHGLMAWRVMPSSLPDVTLEPLPQPTSAACTTLCFSSQRDRLAWAQANRQLGLWDLRNRQPLPAPAPALSLPVSSLALSPDGRRLAFDPGRKPAEVWDLESGTRLYSLSGEKTSAGEIPRGPVVAWSASGTYLAQAAGKAIALCNAEDGRLLLTLPGGPGTVRSLAWSPNRDVLAVGCADGGVAVWDVAVVQAQLASLGLGW